MSRTIIVGVAVSLLVVGVVSHAGGIADNDLKSAEHLEREGKIFSSLQAYLRVLHLEPRNAKARKGAARIADEALAAQRDLATALRRQKQWQEAMTELNTAVPAAQKIRDLELGKDLVSALNDQLAEIRRAWIEELRTEAQRSTADGLYSAAVADLEQVEKLQPGFKDSRELLAAAWTAWGEMDLGAARHRSAAERFAAAAKVPAPTQVASARRAASILAALGRAALARGSCRRAALDLRAAAQLASDQIDAADGQLAESCAVNCLAVVLVADPEAELDSSQVERMAATIRERVAGGASEFLRLREAGRPVVTDCGASSPEAPPRALRADLRVMSMQVMRGTTQTTTRSLRIRDEERRTDAVIGYEEYEEPFTGILAGSVTLSERGTKPPERGIPIRVSATASASWARQPSALAAAGDRPAMLFVSPGEPGRAEVEAVRQRTRARLQSSLVESFATEAARLILATVDVEEAVADPSELPGF